MEYITTFPHASEADKAQKVLDSLGRSYRIIEPTPRYGMVGVSALVIDEEARRVLYGNGAPGFVCAGWVEYRPVKIPVPLEDPIRFNDDLFQQMAIMVLQPCTADTSKIRAIANLSANLTDILPYLNAIMPNGFYNPGGPTLTFMDAHRMVTVFPQRIAIAKADDLIDAWRILDSLRIKVNDCWSRRAQITPSFTARKKPPALEIYSRLPKTNCGQCNEKGCMAFVLKLWSGMVKLNQCKPVFEGSFGHLRDALEQICSGLGEREEGINE